MNINKIKKIVKDHVPLIIVVSAVSLGAAGGVLYYRSLKERIPLDVVWLGISKEEAKLMISEDVPVIFNTRLGDFVVSAK